MTAKQKTVSAHTLGCKVNQYDTQAMLDILAQEGYQIVPYGEESDVILINTCTVTGTGDQKSLKTIRHCHRQFPRACIVACGCLAQREAQLLAGLEGVQLVLGTARREQIAFLLQKALQQDKPLIATQPLDACPFEDAHATFTEERTRAILKIQEGCENRCSYCIIPSVRGPVRSRSLASIAGEVQRLKNEGFCEIVLTGIHLNSYGKDIGASLLDAVILALENAAPARIRLGSLEPTVHDGEFASRLSGYENFCPQFHLALQSGSDSVLARMRRRYNTMQYRASVAAYRQAFAGCSFTTDIIAGFPGESEEEFEQTLRFIDEIGFLKVHAFPFSPRSGTPAFSMPGQISNAVKSQRALNYIRAGEQSGQRFLQTKIGRRSVALFERNVDGYSIGYTEHYCRCVQKNAPLGILTPFIARRELDGVLYADED